MAGYPRNKPSTVVLKCLGCEGWFKQAVLAFVPPRQKLCLDCETRVGNWLAREYRRLSPAPGSVCNACGRGPVVFSKWVTGMHDSHWLDLCADCTREAR